MRLVKDYWPVDTKSPKSKKKRKRVTAILRARYYIDNHYRQQGVCKYWYQSGVPSEISNMHDGKIHGLHESFGTSGRLEVQCLFKNGVEHGEKIMYTYDGSVRLHIITVDGDTVASLSGSLFPNEDRMALALKHGVPMLYGVSS